MSGWLWTFWAFSFGGWLLERGFAAATRSPAQRRRGLLVGPLCPVYGIGVLAVLALPADLLTGWRTYWSGVTVTTAVEYLYHWWGQKFLGVTFWDYTGVPGNFRGRVCLLFSLSWGLLTVPAVHLLAPAVWALAEGVPPFLTWLVLMLFAADALSTLWFLAVTHDLETLRQAVW